MVCREQAERAGRVLHEHERDVGRHVVVQRVDHQARRAARGGIGQKRVTVEAITTDREEGFTDAERSGIDRDPGDGHTEITRDEGALRGAHDVLDGE